MFALLLMFAAVADTPERLWTDATAKYQAEQFASARDALRHFVMLEPEAASGWAVLGMAEFKTREYARAFAHLEKALALGLHDRESLDRAARYLVGVLLTRNERFDEAVQWWMTLAPKYGEASLLYQEAAGLAVLRMPLLPAELPVDRRAMVRTAGRALHALGRQLKGEGRAALVELSERWPDEPGVHFAFGAYLISYEPDLGITELRRELEISPEHVPARVRLVEEYLKRNEVAAAAPLAEAAAKLAPRYSPARLQHGNVLMELDRLPDAIRELEAARSLSPRDATVRWALARAYAAAGREADAERERAEMQKLKEQIR